MERTSWTDERLDDLVARVDNQIELFRGEMAEFRTEIRSELRESRRDMFLGFIAVFGSQVAIFAVLLADQL
jgi:hypothetical protein